jgi:hypothetical protein
MGQQVVIGIVMFTGLLGGSVWAQGRAGVIAPGQARPAAPPAASFKVGNLVVEPLELGNPVENAPFSAMIVNDITQELPDGNRIERQTTGLVARDSRGRVRREQQLATIGPISPAGDARMITISDPVAAVHYSLDPIRKVAVRSRPPLVGTGAQGHPTPTKVKQGVGPGVGRGVPGEPEALDTQSEHLGTKEYEGVRAEGTRTVVTLPAGTIGNVRPIEIVRERWYAPELRVVVFSRRSDPRFGETVYRLTNLTRTEPDASLFQVPADYKYEELKPPPFDPPTDPML